MKFKKKYTDEMVMGLLKKHSDIMAPRQMADKLGCSKVTLENLLRSMLEQGQVRRVNVGTDKKKNWIYSRVNK